ncbi:MAG: DUF1674 domain-containing protein [Acetobacteraceae bacterium]
MDKTAGQSAPEPEAKAEPEPQAEPEPAPAPAFPPPAGEIGGPRGPEPTRYGDWEQKGRCTDF